MPIVRLPHALLLSITIGLFLVGCAQPASVVLWTDIAEMAPIVERFNATHDRPVIELVYRTDIGRQLRLAPSQPDLVVSTYIEDRHTAELLRPLDRLIRSGIDLTAFYAPLVAAGSRDGRQYLLPVSFNLPLIYFAGRIPPYGEPIIITPDEMQARSEGFNQIAAGRLTRVSYSPLWNDRFLYELARIHGMRVRENDDGTPRLPFAGVVAGVTAAQRWIDTWNGGLGAATSFADRYLYEPSVELVRQGRIAYGYTDSAGFFGLSDARRAGLRFRWLGSEHAINVLEDVVYVGIPRHAPNPRGAEGFLTWLFTADTQSAIIAGSHRDRSDSFGLAGGFPALWRVTERFMPTAYPELAGRIPSAGLLRFPEPSPRHWGELTEQVVRPWLAREIRGTPQARDMDGSIRAWLLQQEQ
ncbi:MAG: hypothetical protein EA382_11080 [Spirochaetaceae bacterium]|nr:MAG: hypothetical protein EA382_11080 [Spirochaetaceae bacterium]